MLEKVKALHGTVSCRNSAETKKMELKGSWRLNFSLNIIGSLKHPILAVYMTLRSNRVY
jgi:hypothetical protein